MILLILIMVIVASSVYLAGTFLCNQYIDNVIMSESEIEKRNLAVWREFSKFVYENNVSVSDTKKIYDWIQDKGNIYLNVYSNNCLILSATQISIQRYSVNDGLSLIEVDGADITVYPINFKDGSYRIYAYDMSMDHSYDIAKIFMVAISLTIFLSALTIYIHKITNRIILLGKEAKEISEGNLNKEVSITGRDEISMLAKDINSMRSSLIERIEDEQRAWKANNELLTSISHDIRTPLTVLLGYIELLDKGQYESEKQLKEYIHISKLQTSQLKELADELFSYFYLYGNRPLDLNIQEYDAQLITEQMLLEKIMMVEKEGFNVKCNFLKEKCFIKIDATQLNRVFNNIFSNICKYADQNYPIDISTAIDANVLKISVTNRIADKSSGIKSTKIGIKSCQKIMEQLNGKLIVSQSDKLYSISIILKINRSSKNN